jgi:hypothetical protein
VLLPLLSADTDLLAVLQACVAGRLAQEAGQPVVVEVGRLPDIPEGMEVARVDVIIRLRRKK